MNAARELCLAVVGGNSAGLGLVVARHLGAGVLRVMLVGSNKDTPFRADQ